MSESVVHAVGVHESHRWARAATTALAATSTALVLGMVGIAAPSPAAAAAVAPPSPPPGELVVQPGDTLTGIARAAGVPGGWPALYAANRDAVGASPDRLLPGTVLALPTAVAAAPAAATTTYVVRTGDTLRDVAARAGVDGGWPALLAANRAAIGADPDLLRVGTQLVLPAAAPAPGPAAPGAPSAPAASDPAAPSPAVPAPGTTASADPSSPAAPSAAAAPGGPAAGAQDGSGRSGVPAWVLWPLLVVAVLGVGALVGDPLLALLRRTRHRRAQHAAAAAPSAAAAEPAPEPAPEPSLRLVTSGAAPPVGPVVHVEEHPALMVSYCERDDLVLVMAPRGADAEAVLDIARVVLPESAYRAVERQLPARLGGRGPQGGSVRATG